MDDGQNSQAHQKAPRDQIDLFIEHIDRKDTKAIKGLDRTRWTIGVQWAFGQFWKNQVERIQTSGFWTGAHVLETFEAIGKKLTSKVPKGNMIELLSAVAVILNDSPMS